MIIHLVLIPACKKESDYHDSQGHRFRKPSNCVRILRWQDTESVNKGELYNSQWNSYYRKNMHISLAYPGEI